MENTRKISAAHIARQRLILYKFHGNLETALPTGTTTVPAKHVLEAGSPTLKERAASTVSE